MSPTPHELRTILDTALPIARRAGALLLEGWRGAARVSMKAKSDLVTDYDVASEKLIRDGLSAAFPEHVVIGEEGGGERRQGALSWYVDPIDGTSNFAHGHPFFCVSMGLCQGDEPILGIVVAPAIHTEWAGARGIGATRNGAPMRVSTCGAIDDALMASGFPHDRASEPNNNYARFITLDAASHGVRRCGAGALELCILADGGYDGFWELHLKPWDVAAGVCLVREAGGRVSGFEGEEFDLFAGRILATNGALHEPMIRALAGALPMPSIAGMVSRRGDDAVSERGLPSSREVG